MYNRYKGGGRRPEKMKEPESLPPRRVIPPRGKSLPQTKSPGGITRYIPQKLGELETEDMLLILILYLMYRESGDRELLIIMGAMYLL